MHVDYGACSELQPLCCAFTEALWKWNIVWLHCVWPKEKRTSLIFPSQRNVMLVCWNVVTEVFQYWNCSRRQLAWTKLFKNCTENLIGAGVWLTWNVNQWRFYILQWQTWTFHKNCVKYLVKAVWCSCFWGLLTPVGRGKLKAHVFVGRSRFYNTDYSLLTGGTAVWLKKKKRWIYSSPLLSSPLSTLMCRWSLCPSMMCWMF